MTHIVEAALKTVAYRLQAMLPGVRICLPRESSLTSGGTIGMHL
jgi:hypothetical protein